MPILTLAISAEYQAWKNCKTEEGFLVLSKFEPFSSSFGIKGEKVSDPFLPPSAETIFKSRAT